jgi:UDP-N-acetylglucosamine diphosphorylase/glucosamine-1-phosphate N-acetyltransferase
MKTNSKLKKLLSYKANQDNLRIKAIKSGVNLIAPETIFLSKDTKFGRNVTINPYVVIGKKVRIGNNVKILSFTHIEGAKIENKVTVGPYARIRSGTHLMSGVKIGNFVETKKSKIKSNSKVSHLSYIGDAEIGKNTNIGAGTITCNYDGINKNKTIISDNVFIGSNSSLVAPVKIKKKSTIGAGSVITKDVKENSLALERSEQEEIENYKRK